MVKCFLPSLSTSHAILLATIVNFLYLEAISKVEATCVFLWENKRTSEEVQKKGK